LAGLPSVSLPCECEGGLPVGIQLVGKRGKDGDLLALCKSLYGREERV